MRQPILIIPSLVFPLFLLAVNSSGLDAATLLPFIVWGLIGWCVVAYRRKKDDNELPVQLRYNIPIEILYTVVPIFMVIVLDAFFAIFFTEVGWA